MLVTNDVKVVDSLRFDERVLDVYSSTDVPLFRIADVAAMLGYSEGNAWSLLELCEEDEKLNLPVVVSGQRRKTSFVTENGLYNIFAQSRMPMARKWRKIIHAEIILLRKAAGKSVVDKFDEWDRVSDTLYFDSDTGILMQSITVAGGDVEQIPYVEEK